MEANMGNNHNWATLRDVDSVAKRNDLQDKEIDDVKNSLTDLKTRVAVGFASLKSDNKLLKGAVLTLLASQSDKPVLLIKFLLSLLH